MTQPSAAPRPWRPSGVVTLLSDFGLDDPYVGVMKGVLFRDAPGLRSVVDLTHAIPPGDAAVAGFFLERSFPYFPAGTVHLAVVDPGVGTERALLLVEARGHVFVAPDNGLLGALIEAEPGRVVRQVGPRAPVRGASTTFEGRDRMAPLVARLVDGDPPAAFGPPTEEFRRLELDPPQRLPDGSIAAEVIHVDRFGNLITNAPLAWLAEQGGDWRARWKCRVGGRELALVRTYAEARASAPVALADSYDRMEIAVANGSASVELGMGRGARVSFEPRSSDEAREPARARAGKERQA